MKLEMRVVKNFRGFTLRVDIDYAGQGLGVFGPSGSGKTTLAHLLTGFERPDQGRIILDGQILADAGSGVNLPPEARGLALLFQGAPLFPHLRVAQNLRFSRAGQNASAEEVRKLARVLNIEALLERKLEGLSGGERQRVALGQAILSRPRLLVLDEPFSALDQPLKLQIIAHLRELTASRGLPFVLISHSLLELRLLCREALVLEPGRPVGMAEVETLALDGRHDAGEGYLNLLELSRPQRKNGLWAWQWGAETLYSLHGGSEGQALFQIAARDIILLKRLPGAASARNLLKAEVVMRTERGDRLAVTLRCGKQPLLAEIVPEAAAELGLERGKRVYALFKALALKKLLA
jgi:molybdate transport system ATP-binding protein